MEHDDDSKGSLRMDDITAKDSFNMHRVVVAPLLTTRREDDWKIKTYCF